MRECERENDKGDRERYIERIKGCSYVKQNYYRNILVLRESDCEYSLRDRGRERERER